MRKEDNQFPLNKILLITDSDCFTHCTPSCMYLPPKNNKYMHGSYRILLSKSFQVKTNISFYYYANYLFSKEGIHEFPIVFTLIICNRRRNR